MSEQWQVTQTRGQQTVAVWNQYNPTFTVGTLTLAAHTASLDAMPAAASARDAQQAVLEGTRNERDATLATLRDFSLRVPRKLDGDFLPDDPLHGELVKIRNIEPRSNNDTESRARLSLAVWEAYNAQLAADAPPRPALMVGVASTATLQAALAALAPQEQAVEAANVLASKKRADLRALVSVVDGGNKRWFAAWQGEYADGSPERDALSGIDTEGGGSGGGTPPPPPPPPVGTPGVPVLDSAINSGVVTLTMSATGATLFNVYQRTPGEVDFVLVAGAVLSGWSSGSLTAGSGEWAWQVAGVAEGTEGPHSATTMQGV